MNQPSLLSKHSRTDDDTLGVERAVASPIGAIPIGHSANKRNMDKVSSSAISGLYHQEKEEEDADHQNERSTSKKKRRSRNVNDVPMSFPQKLMEILSDETHADVTSWLQHGKGFMIFQKKRFATEILPRYFKEAKFTSFTRKLNRWNFTRITRGPETGAYYHEFFQRGNIRLCMQMCCQNTKNLGGTSETDLVNSGAEDLSPFNHPSQQLDTTGSMLGVSNDALLQSYGAGVGGGAAQLYPGVLGNQGGQVAQFASDHMFTIHQMEQERLEFLQQQQQRQEAEMAHASQISNLSQSLALSHQNNLLQSLSQSNAGPDSFTASLIQRSNTNAYLAMLMAQEKVNSQGTSLGGFTNTTSLDLQRQQANLWQNQQQQLDQYSQQRMYPQSSLQQHQQQQFSQQQFSQLEQLNPQQINQQQLQLLQLQQQQFQQPQLQSLEFPSSLMNMFQQRSDGEIGANSDPLKQSKRPPAA